MNTAPQTINQDTPSFWDLIRQSVAILWKDWPKDMRVTVLDLQNSKFSLTGECPHCSRPSTFILATSVHSADHPSRYGVARWIAGMQCQGCLEYILASGMFQGNRLYYEAHYPLGKPNETLDPSISKDVAEDFREAIRCHWVKAFRACVVMCRRAIQTSAIALMAHGRTLVEQIDDLATKGTITAPLKEFAHEIRLIGNVGAHSDGMDDVKETDAEDIMAFTRQYLDHVYVMTAKLKARRPSLATPTAALPPEKQ